MKMKKIIALLLSAIMAASILTGCSQAELTALTAYTGMANWETAQQSGTITLEINTEKWSQMMNAFADEMEFDYFAESLRRLNTAPFQTLKVDYTAEVNWETHQAYMNFNIDIDGEVYPVEVYFDRDNITVAKETFASAMRIEEKYGWIGNLVWTGNSTYTYLEFLNAYAGDKDGVCFSLGNEDGYYTKRNKTRKERPSAIAEFIKTGFADYTSSLSSTEGKGVKFEFSYDAIVKEFGNLIVYYIGHKDKIAAAWDKTTADLAEILQDPSADTAGDSQNILPSVSELTGMVDDVKKTIDESETLKELAENAKLTYSRTPAGEYTYNATFDFVLPYQDANVITIYESSTQNKTDKFEEKEYDSVTIADFDTEYQEFLNLRHPVNKATIEWDSYYALAEITFSRQGLNHAVDWTYGEWMEIDDRIYVPMRALAEGLGYEVEWDNENERAYVLDGESRIDMTGLVHEDKTYIKVRDFEKLGCTVDYEENDYDRCTATVTKPGVPR